MAAVNLFKCVLGFNSGKFGWTESYYNKAVTDLDALIAFGDDMANLRKYLLGYGVKIEFIRAQDELKPNVTKIKTVNYVNDLISVPNYDSDVPYSTVMIRIVSVGFSRRMFLLSGAPDRLIVNPPGPTSIPQWDSAFNKWKAYMLDANNGWSLKVFDQTGGNPAAFVSNATVATDVVTITAPLFTTAKGNKVAVKSINPRAFNGRYVIDSIAGNDYTMKPGKTFTANYIEKGTIRNVAFIVDQMKAIDVSGETHRVRGRALKSPRGRRRR